MTLFTLVLALAFLQPVRVSAYVLSKDLLTIEALITLHRAVEKDEDQALRCVATSFDERSLLTGRAVRSDDVHTAFDTKLSNAHSYLVLAGAISSAVNSLYQLVRGYKDFTSNAFNHVSRKPFVAWYYVNADIVISREIKHCYKLYASMTTSGINLMKASVDEKPNLVMTLKTTIDKARYVADNANLYCFLMTDCGWKPDYIQEILSSSIRDGIVDKVINRWKQGYTS